MITHFQIRNFKGWKDTGLLRLAPITVFLGPNSSGKSSLGQFLMMLKQTANSSDRNRVLHPGDSKTPVDLGTFEELAHRHDLNQNLEFTLAWDRPEPLLIKDVITSKVFKGSNIRFEATIGFEKGKGTQAVCRNFKYAFIGECDDTFSVGMKPDDAPGKYRLETEGLIAVRKQGRGWPLPPPSRFFGFPDELNLYYQNGETLNDIAFELQNRLQGMSYLGPLREEPKRYYTWTGEIPEDVGTRGERWLSAFLSSSDRSIRAYDVNIRKARQGKLFHLIVADTLKKLGLIDSFSVDELAKGSRQYRVRVRVRPGSPEVAIPDVGFGVSQVLPVVVQSFYAPANSTIMIEQPELHLHPAVQQNLADLFIAAMKSREEGKDRNIQFMIESHSEHFLRRLQRRIAEDVITKKDVAIYFCNSSEEGSTMTPLEVDLYGNIVNWPANFFGDQMTEIAEMQKAGIGRRRADKEAVQSKSEVIK